MTDDFFRARIDQMIDMRHPLAVLAARLPWKRLEEVLAPCFARGASEGRLAAGPDLFGQTSATQGSLSNAGRPRLAMRLMIGLLYLKHALNLSDEELVLRWSETPVWQYFCGRDYYEMRAPCDATQIGRFRAAIGEAGVEEILAATIDTAVRIKAIKPAELERVIVDSTVQEKAVAHPTDSRLLEASRRALVKTAKALGIELKQTYAKEGTRLRWQAGRYGHAQQYRRMRRVVRRQRTIVGRLLRDFERKVADTQMGAAGFERLHSLLARVRRILTQGKKDKNKLYALHAPEVECISKGKVAKRYEFGVKVGIAVTHKGGLIVGARSFPGNPYDGHTLPEQLEQANILMQRTGHSIMASDNYLDRSTTTILSGWCTRRGVRQAVGF